MSQPGTERLDFFTEHARELLGMSGEWQVYHYEVVGNKPAHAYKLTGKIPVINLLGEEDWDKADPTTERTAFITPAQHDQWLAAWERATGKCHKCQGTGQEPAGWSVDEGARFRSCRKCDATGLSNPPLPNTERNAQ